MRAYLSAPGVGPTFLDAPHVADVTGRVHHVPTMARDDERAGQWAEHEARRILAETEPSDPVPAVAGWQHPSTRYAARCWHTAASALAESLAAFIAADIR